MPFGGGRFIFELWEGTGKETSQVVERWESLWFPRTMEPAMPAKRGPEPGQFEDHVKRIARRLIARRKQRNASGRRGDHEPAAKLIEFQQHQDRMELQHEFERLDRYQASAAQLQAEAARQLRRRRATTKASVTPDGKTRIEFRAPGRS
jgi:hypothetical protein